MSNIKESITKACESFEAMSKAMNEAVKQGDDFPIGGTIGHYDDKFFLEREIIELKGQIKWLRKQIDMGNREENSLIDRINELTNQNTKLNTTIDVLLEKLKGK
jgi:hypothetical protein